MGNLPPMWETNFMIGALNQKQNFFYRVSLKFPEILAPLRMIPSLFIPLICTLILGILLTSFSGIKIMLHCFSKEHDNICKDGVVNCNQESI